MKNMTFNVYLLLALSSISLLATAQTPTAPACKALVQMANDLYLVDVSGTKLAQFTNDGLSKNSASLAPDGSKVAYITDDNADTFVVTDLFGRKQTYALPTTDGPLVAVTWATSDIVRLDKHIGLGGDRFEFYKVPADLSSLRKAANPGFGSDCALSNTNDVVCLQGNDITKGNNTIIYSDNGLDNTTQQDSLLLTIGSTTSVQGVSGLQIQVKSILEGITLHVTLPTGNWLESRVEPRGFMTVRLEGQTLRLYPTVTNATKGTVHIVVLSVNEGSKTFNNALAWSPDDNDVLAVIKKTTNGPVLTFLKRTQNGIWNVLGKTPLEIGEEIGAMRFLSPTLLFFATQAQFGLAPTNISHSTSGTKLEVGKISGLPKSMTVNFTSVPVMTQAITWICN